MDKTPGEHQARQKDRSSRPRQAGAQNPPQEIRETPAPFAAQESPDDLSDSGGGIRKRPVSGMTRSKDPGLGRFVRLGGTSVLDSDPIIVVCQQN
ncbi:MAG: hypothetical protein C5S48_01230 [Candidatus Methanogaster sp.]|nr:MAG: hypothetical protein C5S48_01230 [ANME-2 cluster archaeon]